MLGEFSNIVSDNVLDGLPLVRKISHQMDLIQGASFPNKATHRMKLIESEESNGKVNALLQKGLILESLSPCVVLEVLAPQKNREWRMCIDMLSTRSQSSIDFYYLGWMILWTI